MTDEMLNGDETGYAVGLPVWVEVAADGSVTFIVDLSEADEPDDLAQAQDHLTATVRAAVLARRYTINDGLDPLP